MAGSIEIIGVKSSHCRQPTDVLIELQAEDGRHDPLILSMKGTIALAISDALRLCCHELGFFDQSQQPQ